MLTYSHNHAPGILLWQCSCHRNEKQNFKSFFNYDANLTSVITIELKFIFLCLRCWLLCMTSLTVTSSMLKTSLKFSGTSFKFWLRPWNMGNILFSTSQIADVLYVSNNRWYRKLLITSNFIYILFNFNYACADYASWYQLNPTFLKRTGLSKRLSTNDAAKKI